MDSLITVIFISFFAMCFVNVAKSSSIVKLTTVEDLNNAKKDNPIVVVGYFKSLINNSAYDAFKKVAKSSNDDEVAYAVATNRELFDEAKLKDDKIVLYKKSDKEKRFSMKDDVNENSLRVFVHAYRMDLVTEFDVSENNVGFIVIEEDL
jgi:hypothetical protein